MDQVFATMKGISLCAVVLIISILNLDAFLSYPKYERTNKGKLRRDMVLSKPIPYGDCFTNTLRSSSKRRTQTTTRLNSGGDSSDVNGNATPSSSDSVTGDAVVPSTTLSYEDILWKLRPPPETPWRKRLWLRFAANVIRLDCKLKGQQPPLVLCPKGGQAMLEAYYRPDKTKRKYVKIAKFGFTTERGPSNEPIQETIHEFYGIEKNRYNVGIGAIIYMFVEPEYRKKNVGIMALQIISMIHSIQGCDFTVLVANDGGSGKLIPWYEQHGYKPAPALQQMMGSPNGIYGTSMISPTQQAIPDSLCLKWW